MLALPGEWCAAALHPDAPRRVSRPHGTTTRHFVLRALPPPPVSDFWRSPASHLSGRYFPCNRATRFSCLRLCLPYPQYSDRSPHSVSPEAPAALSPPDPPLASFRAFVATDWAITALPSRTNETCMACCEHPAASKVFHTLFFIRTGTHRFDAPRTPPLPCRSHPLIAKWRSTRHRQRQW